MYYKRVTILWERDELHKVQQVPSHTLWRRLGLDLYEDGTAIFHLSVNIA